MAQNFQKCRASRVPVLTLPLRFADVFDDVIGNVRASGGLGDVADDCVRGAVHV